MGSGAKLIRRRAVRWHILAMRESNGLLAFSLRVLGSVFVIAAGAFTWVFIGVAWCFCSMGWHRKAARLAQHGTATLIGGVLGLLLLVGFYCACEWFGCRIMGRC
jgi:hypothetical protein